MLGRQTRAAGSTTTRVENAAVQQAALKAKVAAAPIDALGGQQRRAALKDLTNVQANGANQAGRVRKISKPAPVAASTKAAITKAVKRPAETELEPMEIAEETVVGQVRNFEEAVIQAVSAFGHRATKKRKSEPESDPMQVDDEEVVMADDDVEIPEHTFVTDAQPVAQDAAAAPAAAPSASTAAVEDIDLYDWDDPQAVAEYVEDIYSYMREVEVRFPFEVPHVSVEI